MKHRFITTAIFVLIGICSYAQSLMIQGRVMHEGEPLAKANVMEVDANQRIKNQTLTDDAGFFTMNVTGEKTSIRVTYNGMRRYTHKIGTKKTWEINLQKESDKESQKKVKSRHESRKLLVGHLQGRVIPQIVWMEHLTDTTFCMIIPVRVYNSVEEYPIGRKVTIQDNKSRIVATGKNIEAVVPEEGLPDSWDPFVRTTSNNSANNNSQFTTDDRDYFCYPRFLFTRSELEYMIDNSDELVCFAVDTARGDNYWMYYPGKNFAKEMQKILKRMLK